MNLVLIITKDSTIGQAIEKAIDPSKYLVWVSYSLQEARTMLGQQNTSAIIIDAQSDIDAGLEFIETVKLKLGKLAIACVMLCATDAKINMKKILRAGVDEVMVWPSPPEDIVKKLEQHIEEYKVHQGTKLLEYRQEEEYTPEHTLVEGGGIADHIPSSGDPLRFNQPGVLSSSRQPEPHFEAYTMNPKIKPPAIEIGLESDEPKTEIFHPPKRAEDGEKILGSEATGSQYTTEHDHRRGVHDGGSTSDIKTIVDKITVEKAVEQLTPERIEKIAAEILDQKLTEAARTNIRRIIAQAVRDEIDGIMPDLIENVKAKL